VDCIVGEWSGWDQCTKSCDGGTQIARRDIIQHPEHDGEACPVDASSGEIKHKIQDCNPDPCPQDCQVTSWTPFSDCTLSCAEVISNFLSGESTDATHTRTREIIPDTQLHGGKACPHTFEKAICNTYGQCMNQFFIAETPAPTPGEHDWDALDADETHHSLDDSMATVATPSPTPTTTAAPVYTPNNCTNGNEPVDHGWHGAGAGSNWCNLCSCNDGLLSCQQRACGTDSLLIGHTSDGQEYSQECSHVSCSVQEHFEADAEGSPQVTHRYVQVQHNHSENFGSLHHCAHMFNTDECKCKCYGNTFQELRDAHEAVIQAAMPPSDQTTIPEATLPAELK
jgi:hypothetical protein